MLNKSYDVLDNGFLRLVEYMGDDNSIVQAARTSTGKGITTPERDRELIRYLMRNEHTSPFEMVEMKWHAKMPIFVARQWVRHRTANLNEFSGRYSVFEKEYYVPDNIRLQSTTNKQGGEVNISESEAKNIKQSIIDSSEKAWESYTSMIDKGIAREQARMILPVNYYTQWYWKNDLKNTLHFLKLRTNKHAQWEIREYANLMGDIVKDIVPFTYEAFEDYVINGKKFSRLELEVIQDQNKHFLSSSLLKQKITDEKLSKQEKLEFKQKLKKTI